MIDLQKTEFKEGLFADVSHVHLQLSILSASQIKLTEKAQMPTRFDWAFLPRHTSRISAFELTEGTDWPSSDRMKSIIHYLRRMKHRYIARVRWHTRSRWTSMSVMVEGRLPKQRRKTFRETGVQGSLYIFQFSLWDSVSVMALKFEWSCCYIRHCASQRGAHVPRIALSFIILHAGVVKVPADCRCARKRLQWQATG